MYIYACMLGACLHLGWYIQVVHLTVFFLWFSTHVIDKRQKKACPGLGDDHNPTYVSTVQTHMQQFLCTVQLYSLSIIQLTFTRWPMAWALDFLTPALWSSSPVVSAVSSLPGGTSLFIDLYKHENVNTHLHMEWGQCGFDEQGTQLVEL